MAANGSLVANALHAGSASSRAVGTVAARNGGQWSEKDGQHWQNPGIGSARKKGGSEKGLRRAGACLCALRALG